MDDYCSMPRGFKEYKSSDTPPSDEILGNKNILFEIIKNSVDGVSTRFNIQLFYDILFHTRQLRGLKFYYNSIDKNGDTPLHAAIRQGNRDILYHIFNKSHFSYDGNEVVKDVSTSSFSVKNKGDIPLRLAIKLNFEVEYILDLYLCHMDFDDFVRVTSNPLPLIHLLVDRAGSIYRILKRYKDAPYLIQKLGASKQDEHGNTILHLLVNKKFDPIDHDRVECFYFILNMELLAIQNEDGNTPVHLLCIHGYFGVLKNVMEQCQNIFKLQNKDGNTLLHLLCMNGNVLLKDALEYDTDEALDKQNKDGNTPLHLALLYMNHDIHTGMNMAFDILKLLHQNAPGMVPELLHMSNRDWLTPMKMITTKIADEQEKLTQLLLQCFEEECIKDGEIAEQQEIVSRLKALKPLLEAKPAYSNDESAGPRNRVLVPFPVPVVPTTAPLVPGIRNGDSAAGPGGKRKTKHKSKTRKKYKSKKYKH